MTPQQTRRLQDAIAHQRAGRFAEAGRLYNRVLKDAPDNFDCIYLLGTLHAQQGNFDSAVGLFRRAAAMRPDVLEIRYNLAVALSMAGHHAEAAQIYERVLQADPRHAQARNNYAATLLTVGRAAEALRQYDELIERHPAGADAYNNRGMALQYLKRLNEALASYDKAVALKPDFPQAYVNRGNVLAVLQRPDEALAAFNKAIALEPDFADAYANAGNIYCKRKHYGAALDAYGRALALRPDDSETASMRFYVKMHLFDWSDFAAERAELIACIDRGLPLYPFSVLAASASAEQQLRSAKLFAKSRYPLADAPLWHGEIYRHDKIRVAYVSADFRAHAVAQLTAGMFECHDKAHFDVTAISIGPDDRSALRGRLQRAFDRFIDAGAMADDEIAARIRDMEIDVLIDLNGFTEGARMGIFARRPAPIQASYLGYAGTTGTDYMDYLIADRILIPPSQRAFYSEKIVYLPHSYQANDSKRPISDKVFSRAELGLPDHGFVFCCFNNAFKIGPDIFDGWARVLERTPGSVLWLREDNSSAVANLRKEAAARRIGAERVVFAQRMPSLADHLARHRAADLFLDTLPYNAQTTASDALWAGLPVLTQLGETFTGRVAASLLNAIGVAELIAPTRQDYENAAVDLAAHPGKLAAIRHKLAQNRSAAPLFDTQLFTRHIESAYAAMLQRYQAGLTADHIDVPSRANSNSAA